MKRFIEWFTDWTWKFEVEQIVGFAISGLLGIALTIMLFVSMDTSPATSYDYKKLEDQVKVIKTTIQQNPELLLEADWTVENEQVKVVIKYDKASGEISISEEDKAISVLTAIVVSLIVGGGEVYLVGWLLTLVISETKMAIQRIQRIKSKS